MNTLLAFSVWGWIYLFLCSCLWLKMKLQFEIFLTAAFWLLTPQATVWCRFTWQLQEPKTRHKKSVNDISNTIEWGRFCLVKENRWDLADLWASVIVQQTAKFNCIKALNRIWQQSIEWAFLPQTNDLNAQHLSNKGKWIMYTIFKNIENSKIKWKIMKMKWKSPHSHSITISRQGNKQSCKL